MASKKTNDPRQNNFDRFFAIPRPLTSNPGSSAFDLELRNHLNAAIKDAPIGRIEIAAKMTILIYGDAGDGEVTKVQIDSWTAASRAEWRFPLSYLPAFIEATGAVWLLDKIAERIGCRVLVGEQALLAELGALLLHEKRIKTRKGQLEKAVPPEVLESLIKTIGSGS